MKPTLGRIVLIGIYDKTGKLCAIPAIIVKIWSDTMVNVIAFNDGSNDLDYVSNQTDFGIKWKTSLELDTNTDIPSNGKWIWPPRS